MCMPQFQLQINITEGAVELVYIVGVPFEREDEVVGLDAHRGVGWVGRSV